VIGSIWTRSPKGVVIPLLLAPLVQVLLLLVIQATRKYLPLIQRDLSIHPTTNQSKYVS
jgi:hypothetical protein